MIIDTIFICFCEDCEKNDGISRPYFMSRGLMVCIIMGMSVLSLFLTVIVIYKKKSYSGIRGEQQESSKAVGTQC